MFVRATWCDSEKIGGGYGRIKQTGFMAPSPALSQPDRCLGENCARLTEMTRGLFDR